MIAAIRDCGKTKDFMKREILVITFQCFSIIDLELAVTTNDINLNSMGYCLLIART